MVFWRRGGSDRAGGGPVEDVAAAYARLARTHLAPDVAERWLALVRPAIALTVDPGDGPVVGRLGGVPRLPPGVAWPTWEGHGALQHVAEIDLAAVAASGLDAGVALPTAGRLLAFFYDGPGRDDPDGTVGEFDPATAAGSRLLHLDLDAADGLPPATVPPGVAVIEEQTLHARQTATWPRWENPALEEAFGDEPDEVLGDDFLEAVEEVDAEGTTEQLGGWAASIQYPVDADLRAARPVGPRCALVLQVGSAGGMEWGDMGTLYWLAPVDELPRLDGVTFTWQT